MMNSTISPWESTPPKCSKCNDAGILHTLEWVEDPEYTNSKGEPIRYEKAQIKACECRFERMFEKYNASAGMKAEERERTFQAAEIDEDNKPHYQLACEFIRHIDKHKEWGTWLYIHGDEERATERGCSAFGTGKTYLIHCIGNALTARKIPALYVTEDKLFQDIKDTYDRDSEHSESDVLNRYYNVPILLIDDLFSAQYKEWAESKLFSILDNRMGNKKITIITSNYAPNRIKQRLPINGAKIASRIIGESQLIEMIGKDRRKTQARKRYETRKGYSREKEEV